MRDPKVVLILVLLALAGLSSFGVITAYTAFAVMLIVVGLFLIWVVGFVFEDVQQW